MSISGTLKNQVNLCSMSTFSSIGHIRVNSTALLNCISYIAGAQRTVWGEVFDMGEAFYLYSISGAALWQTKPSHKH